MEQRHEPSQIPHGLIMQEEIIESEDNGNEEFIDEDNGITTAGMAGTSALRRRKGKIISCAKETIENGELYKEKKKS